MSLKGVLGVLHRFKKEFWCGLLSAFFRFVKACRAPFWIFLAPKACKKGSSRFALYQCDFSGCWTPFWWSCSPNLAKRGPAACSFGVPWSSLSFSSCWAPFCVAGVLDPPKRGPAAPDFRFVSFSWCWTPFWAVSGRDPPKRGAATWRQTSFHLDLFSGFAAHRGCTCVSSLCSFPLCLWPLLSLCGRSCPETSFWTWVCRAQFFSRIV